MAGGFAWKRTYSVIVGAIVIISSFIFYKIKKRNFLDHGVTELVNSKTNSLYNVTYDSISVNEIAGDVLIQKLYLRPDTARQMQMINSGDTNAAKILLDIQISSLKVDGFKTAKALLSKRMDCDSIQINDPIIRVYVYPGIGKNKDPESQRQELYRQILGNFKLLKAKKVIVSNAHVITLNFFTKETKFQTYNTNINLIDVAVDSTYNQDTSRTLFCKQITITSDKVSVGEENKNAEITNAVFDTRSKIVSMGTFEYDATKTNGTFKTLLRGITLEGITWKGPVEESDLEIGKAIFAKAELTSLTGPAKNKTTSITDKHILTGWVKTFSLGSLQLKSLDYISQPVDKKERPLTLKNNSFSIKNLYIDRKSVLDRTLVERAGEIELANKEINIESTDGFYRFQFQGLRISSGQKKMFAQSIRVIPKYNEEEFVRRARYQTDRYDIEMNNLSCSGVDINKFFRDEVYISTMTSDKSRVSVYRDLSYPIDSAARRAAHETWPQQLIHKLPFKIKVNKLTANNLYLEYKEKNPVSQSSGKVRFVNSTLVISNITNWPAAKGETMTAAFKTMLLGKIPMKGSFTFLMDQWRKGLFIAEASVENSFDATILTELTEPMSLARIEKGTIKKIIFSTKADTSYSHGNLKMTYEDLKISLLKKKGDEYNKKGLLSILANVIVKNKNEEGDKMRTAQPVVPRNRFKSFFNYIWKTIFKGITDVIVMKI